MKFVFLVIFPYICTPKNLNMTRFGNLNIEAHASAKTRVKKVARQTTSYVKVKPGSNSAPKKAIKLIRMPEGVL